jgi:predicted metalloendopeptidase
MSESDRKLSGAAATAGAERLIFAHPNRRVSMRHRSTTRLVRAVLLCLSLSLPATRGASAQAADHPAIASLERSVDPGVAPGDDFFAYANARWLATTAIPSGKDRWSAREEIAQRTREQIDRLLADARSAAPRSLARSVATFEDAYASESAIERSGLAPLRAALDSIDAVRNRVALARLLGSEMRADVDPLGWGLYRSANLLGLAVQHGIHGETGYTPFLVQGGLGLGDRERYLDSTSTGAALRARYLTYVAHQLAQAGFDSPERRAAGVLALETGLARSHATTEASAVDRNADNVWTRADFARRAPGFDWTAFFRAARLGAQPSFVAWQPSAITGLATLVGTGPLEEWKDYLRFHAIDVRADVLPRRFAEPALAMHDVKSSRAERARALTLSALSDEVSRLYARRYFTARQKQRVQDVVAKVKAEFLTRVEAATWMTDATRAQAATKVRTSYVGIGYPDRWPRRSELDFSPTDPARNVALVAERGYRDALARLHQPFDVAEWLMPAHQPGAILIFQQNTYDFSAALLQPPKFDAAASNAAAYGAIGAIIGHDLTHFVDVLGADYDTTGAMRRWWTPADSIGFESVARPLVEQYASYQPFPDARVDGMRTRTESVADLGGLVAAFDAHRRSLGHAASDSALVRRLDREFFIAFAQSWRSKETDAALRTRLATDSHAPDRFRVAIVRNLDAWYDAFDVRPGERLYLAPAARVRVW